MANKHEHNDEEEEAMIKAMMAEPVTNRRFAFFMNEVSSDTVRPICEWIFGNNFDTSDTRPNELTLVINSPGGSLHDAFALIDIMKGSQIPIRTIGLGLVASAGLLIFMAGVRGKRTLTPNTSVLSHQWSWGAVGKQHELVAKQKEYSLTQKRILRHYQRCTGMSLEKIKKLLLAPHDQYLDADEALKLGLCDSVQDMDTFIPKTKKTRAKK